MNNLDTITDEAFADLGNLKKLNLSDNKLARIPTMSFR